MSPHTRAYIFAAGTILGWSTVASAFKLSLKHLNYAELLAGASFVSLVVLAVIVRLTGRLGDLRTWTRRDFIFSAGLGFLNPALYYLILFQAYNRLPAQEAQPLNFTWPIVLVLLSIVVLRQKVSMRTMVSMSMSFFGVWVISTRGDVLSFAVSDGLGVALALGSTLVWAAYWTLNVKDRRDPILRLMVNFIFGFGYVAIYLVTVNGLRPWPVAGVLGAIYVGLFEMGLTFVCWIYALKLARNAAQVSGLIFVTPFLSLVVVYFVLGERIMSSTVLGLVFIVTGIAMQHLRRT